MCKEQTKVATTEPISEVSDPALQSKQDKNHRTITLSELKSHNKPSDAWCAVHGDVLDISTFAKRHPGGDLIFLSAGMDATILVETYHPRGVPKSLMEKLKVGVMGEDEITASFYSWDSDFYPTLRKRVVARLAELKLNRRGSIEITIKALFLLAGFWGSLYKMFTSPSFTEAAPFSALMGIFASFVGTCIQHDGNHGAFSTWKSVNKMAGWTMDMIGASAFTWEFQHMLGHHPYTNLLDVKEDVKKGNGVDCAMNEKDQESDPDVFSSFPLMRMHPVHKPSSFHRYQHLYAPVLFAFMTLAKVFQQDIEVVLQGRLYHIDATSRYGSIWNVLRFWGMKAVSTVYMIGLPCYFHGVGKGLGLFLIGHLVCGEMLATFFIVNHVIEGVSFAKKNETGQDGKCKPNFRPTTVNGNTPMEKTRYQSSSKKVVPLNDWAAVQCQTSVNWSSGSWFWNNLSGGLSHQIEHHLFPSICHTNYVYIQDVVEDTCAEYGVPYQNEPSLLVAYVKMLRHLRYLGRGEDLMEEKKRV